MPLFHPRQRIERNTQIFCCTSEAHPSSISFFRNHAPQLFKPKFPSIHVITCIRNDTLSYFRVDTFVSPMYLNNSTFIGTGKHC